jgi:hypothetical protein
VFASGFAIRAELMNSIGGLEADYDSFSATYLSAQLVARGIKIEMIAGAAITHVDERDMAEQHTASAGYVRGEFDARQGADPVFLERHFGHVPRWANQLKLDKSTARAMSRAVLSAALAHPQQRASLARLLPKLIADRVAGTAPRIALHRLAVGLDRFAVERLPMPRRWRTARFVRAHARLVRLTQFEWIRDHPATNPPSLAHGCWPIERLGPHEIVGVHGLEEHGRGRFRWTEPVAMLRLAPHADDCELRIDTGGIRGDPLSSLIAVVVGDRILPREFVTSERNEVLIIRLPAGWLAATRDGIVLVCSALTPARFGKPDPRQLGLPIVSIEVVPRHDPAVAVAAE